MKALAVVLIVAGAIMMIITGVNVATKEKVVDLGKLEINKTKNHPISWSPIIGVVLIVAGVGTFFMSKKKLA